MRKRNKYILCGLLLILFISGILMLVIQNKAPEVKAFEVSDYQNCIDNFSSEETVGSISGAKDAVAKAEIIWVKTFGARVKKEKPYQVSYDAEKEVWLIQGSLPSGVEGGVANILIENRTGNVLAVWHDK